MTSVLGPSRHTWASIRSDKRSMGRKDYLRQKRMQDRNDPQRAEQQLRELEEARRGLSQQGRDPDVEIEGTHRSETTAKSWLRSFFGRSPKEVLDYYDDSYEG